MFGRREEGWWWNGLSSMYGVTTVITTGKGTGWVEFDVEDFMDVVGDEAVATPLAEEPGSDEDEEAAVVAFGAGEFHLAIAQLLFHSDSVSDLGSRSTQVGPIHRLACTSARTFRARSSRPFDKCQWGDSGTNQTKMS
jgi:hypothetical protein